MQAGSRVHLARLAKEQAKSNPHDTGRVRRVLEGVASNAMGNSITLNPGERATILQNQASDFDIQQLTLSLQVTDPGNLAVPRPQLCYAAVTFGVGGSTQTVECSIKQGTTLSLVAAAIRVEGIYLPAVIAPIPLDFHAQLAYGTRPGRARAPSWDTPPQPVILPGGFADFLVPAFASALSVFTSDATAYTSGTGILIRELNGPGLTILEVDSVSPPNQLQSIPIYAGCNIIRLFNNSLVPFFPALVFELGL